MQTKKSTFKHLIETIPNLKDILNLSNDVDFKSDNTPIRDEMYFKKIQFITKAEVYVNATGTIVLVDGISVKFYDVVSRVKSVRKQISAKGKKHYVHRLVASAFVINSKPLSHKLVCHKNGKSDDNHYSNLVWGNATTYTNFNKQNFPHIFDYILRKDDKLGNSKFTKADRLNIAKELDSGAAIKPLAAQYNVSDMTITRIRQRYCKKKILSNKYSKDTKHIVAHMFKDDKHSDVVIAYITGINYTTVYRWRKLWKNDKFPQDAYTGLNGQPIKHVNKRSKLHYQPALIEK